MHRGPDPADRGRANEARSCRGRRRRDQALSGTAPERGTTTMRSGVIAQKVGMTRVFTDAGEHVPVTVLRLATCQVVAHRTKDKNGYVALQLGSGARKPKSLTKATPRHLAVPKVEPQRNLADLRGD